MGLENDLQTHLELMKVDGQFIVEIEQEQLITEIREAIKHMDIILFICLDKKITSSI